MNVSDQLVMAAGRGDAPAIAELLTMARPRLRRDAERSCLVSDVDDAVQEALLVVLRRIGQLRQVRAFSGWLFRVVRRECHRLARTSLRVDLWDDTRTEATLAAMDDAALRMELAAALESLPPHYREVLLLRDFEELTIAEIGKRLAIGKTAVKSRLHRARVLTREYLID